MASGAACTGTTRAPTSGDGTPEEGGGASGGWVETRIAIGVSCAVGGPEAEPVDEGGASMCVAPSMEARLPGAKGDIRASLTGTVDAKSGESARASNVGLGPTEKGPEEPGNGRVPPHTTQNRWPTWFWV